MKNINIMLVILIFGTFPFSYIFNISHFLVRLYHKEEIYYDNNSCIILNSSPSGEEGGGEAGAGTSTVLNQAEERSEI